MDEPMSSGAHFYADLRSEKHGIHFVDFLAGDLKEDLNLWVTTS